MKISLSNNITHGYKPQEFENLSELVSLLTSGKNYSCGIFKDGYRNNQNFEKTYTIGLDIDNGVNEAQMTIVEAKDLFKEHKHIIMPSKSHQKDKNGIVADRFRVILFLDKPIDNKEDYYATWYVLKNKYPAIDPQCKDPARFWYPSTTSVSQKDSGKTISVVKHVEKAPLETPNIPLSKGKLARTTMEFLTFGAQGMGWNQALTKATIDLREQGYDKPETITMLSKATGFLDEADHRCVDSIYNKEMRYEARDDGECFKYQTISEIYESTEVVEWFMDRMLMKGGLSIIGGDPKAGKSTIVRQLCKNILCGEEFLGRKSRQCKTVYYAMEEFIPMIKEQFQQVGLPKDADLIVHAGGMKNFDKRYEKLEEDVIKHGFEFVVIDTMGLFCEMDLNDYNSVNKELMKIREIARSTGCHIMLIHHINKGYMGKSGTLLGSQAIKGAFDTIILFNKHGKDRLITTEGRGINPFWNRKLEFDWNTQTYTLGELTEEDF